MLTHHVDPFFGSSSCLGLSENVIYGTRIKHRVFLISSRWLVWSLVAAKVAEHLISANRSQVTGLAEQFEMVQYLMNGSPGLSFKRSFEWFNPAWRSNRKERKKKNSRKRASWVTELPSLTSKPNTYPATSGMRTEWIYLFINFECTIIVANQYIG
jgi:hypothetical protein